MKKKTVNYRNQQFYFFKYFFGTKIQNLHKKNQLFKFFKKNEGFLSNFEYVLNCSLHRKYVLEKYNKKYDLDYLILNKIKNLNANYIFLSSRKIYKSKLNILEIDKILPKNNYEKNKLITENYIKKLFLTIILF